MPVHAQGGAPVANPAPWLITAPIDETRRVRLSGNVRPEANAHNDRGRVPDALSLRHMQLLLRRPVARELALQQYLHDLQDRTSPSFHRWLNPAQLAQSYGPSMHDLRAISGWLQQQGFTVNSASQSSLIIDFSGTAGQVRSAFRTEIHSLAVNGRRHIANMSDPQIPAALAPLVVGIVSLNDFRPYPLHRPRAQYTLSSGQTLLSPADLATLYDLQPLFSAGDAGQGQTVVVLEDTDVYSSSDWSTFRSTFGLDAYGTGSLSQQHPARLSGRNNCSDPGVGSGGVDEEAILDAEWASAAAPGASIELASCADTSTTFGGLIALQNLLEQSSPPAIVSLSYGECEAVNGATANAAFSSAYQQADAEGVSVFVAAGDAGAAGCDDRASYATHGTGVSGLASTPYDVAVGGTDFADTYTHTTASYWSASNGPYYGSALSYIPEVPWNDSCAGALLSQYEGYSSSYGSSGFCNSPVGSAHFLTTTAGSGGPSSCASGMPATPGVVGGSCSGSPKPGWQDGVPGIADDGVRDLPDVSLFAGNGLWGHYYVVCWSDTAAGGAACSGAPSGWSGAGGTSFGAPILAGIQALVNQRTGARQGNPDPVYYTLAASQYASGLDCNSSAGNAVASGCVFYNVTLGDMDVDCNGSNDCYLPSGSVGVLTTDDDTQTIAYAAAGGWNFATGLGSVNAGNLANYWDSSDLSLMGSAGVTGSGELSYALSVGNSGPQNAGGVLVRATLPSGVGLDAGASSSGCTQSGVTLSCSLGGLAAGSTVPVSIVLAPGTAPVVGVSFAVSSSAVDLDPNNDLLTIDLSVPGNGSAADAPMPPWAGVSLGALLLLIAMSRQRSRGARLER
ncbi:MAG TPA: protease pro-enzyme activation domain-containing protein [Steroidobacteraceae bacterium]|nr:protease pro-enzyme activation domain-containing protein [Steroidobacteraceae bacterium]